jgi:hypothetical protein
MDLQIDMSAMSQVEQAEFYAATRQFSRALDAYAKVLADPGFAKSNPFDWEASARAAIAITVRVKNDPRATLKIVNQLEKIKKMPNGTRNVIKAWKKSIQDWSQVKSSTIKKLGLSAKIDRAGSWIQLAQKRQEFPLDHSQDIFYFRASSLLHDVLESPDRSPALSAKALYLSGIAAEATRDMNFWTLHETYFEQCIRADSHSDQAKKCFDRLKESITLGYSGSAGVQIPPEINQRLEMFQALALPATK